MRWVKGPLPLEEAIHTLMSQSDLRYIFEELQSPVHRVHPISRFAQTLAQELLGTCLSRGTRFYLIRGWYEFELNLVQFGWRLVGVGATAFIHLQKDFGPPPNGGGWKLVDDYELHDGYC
jgi:hypothetical protein